MQTYYDILGVLSNASDEQIKAAFRRLAKLYHPDKNPNGKDQFEEILNAYEVLSDSARRRQYDLRLQSGASSSSATAKRKAQTKATQKNGNISEEELKRRQYYQEHYKKEYQQYVKNQVVSDNKKKYNEYKYILFAAPLAVALFMLVMNGLESGSKTKTESDKTTTSEIIYKEIEMGTDPYTPYFNNPLFDSTASRSMVIKNMSANDVIVNLRTKDSVFVRSCVIKTGYFVEVDKLPSQLYYIDITAGKQWNGSKEFKGIDVIGGFEDTTVFYRFNLANTNGWTITLDEALLNQSDTISAMEFFKRN